MLAATFLYLCCDNLVKCLSSLARSHRLFTRSALGSDGNIYFGPAVALPYPCTCLNFPDILQPRGSHSPNRLQMSRKHRQVP